VKRRADIKRGRSFLSGDWHIDAGGANGKRMYNGNYTVANAIKREQSPGYVFINRRWSLRAASISRADN